MTTSIQISATQVNTNIEDGTVIITGIDINELMAEFNAREVLEALNDNDDYADIVEFVAECEKDKEE